MTASPNPGPIPAADGLPARGALGDATERLCGLLVGATTCGEPASTHIIWEDHGTYVEHGWACVAHTTALSGFTPFAVHGKGDCCGMPGSRYFPEENECRYDDGLPVAEPVRAIAQEAPA